MEYDTHYSVWQTYKVTMYVMLPKEFLIQMFLQTQTVFMSNAIYLKIYLNGHLQKY